MAFSYLLEYAGVPFCLDEGKVFRASMQPPSTEVEASVGPKKFQPLADLIDELDRLLPFKYLDDFGSQYEELGHNLNALAFQQYSNRFPNPEIKIGDWYYPSQATRWSVFRGLATSSQVKAMMTAVTASTPRTFTMKAAPVSPDNLEGSDAAYTLSTLMYMLPPRPLAEHGGQFDGLYLVTLVDERYYWQYSPVSLKVTGETTWVSLLNQLVSLLGITLTVGPISAAYSTPEPDSQLWTSQENAAILLDAIAFNIGCKLVRYLDGTYELQTAARAQTLALANRGTAASVVRLAGGDIFNIDPTSKAGDLSLSENFVMPQAVRVTFPKYIVGDDPVPHSYNVRYQNQRPTTWYEQSHADTYAIDVPLFSGGIVSTSGISTSGLELITSGLFGVAVAPYHVIHSTAKALFSGEIAAIIGSGPLPPGPFSASPPLNQSGLASLAVKIASDYYSWQTGYAIDESFPGTFAWLPEGFDDIIWTYSARARRACTRVMQTIWNQIIREMQHAAHPLSGFTSVPPGVGGHSVSQTIRDSQASGSVTTSLYLGLTSGFPRAFFTGVDYLPTQNRWKGKIDNEIILFEGTSGGISGFAVDIVYRGVDSTIQADHNDGATVFQVTPNTSYGINLSTYEKGQFVYSAEQTSGGIAAVRVVPPLQTVKILSACPLVLNNQPHYSGRLNLYNVASGAYEEKELVFVVERNQKAVQSGNYYDGQLVGYSRSATLTSPSAPIYLINNVEDPCIWGQITGYNNDTTYSFTQVVLQPDGVTWQVKANGVVSIAKESSGNTNVPVGVIVRVCPNTESICGTTTLAPGTTTTPGPGTTTTLAPPCLTTTSTTTTLAPPTTTTTTLTPPTTTTTTPAPTRWIFSYCCGGSNGGSNTTVAPLTTPPPIITPYCTGQCTWTWDALLAIWVLTCSDCPNVTGCICQYPQFCGINNGDTTKTFCAYGTPPAPCCTSTTPVPTTTITPTTTGPTTTFAPTPGCTGCCWRWYTNIGQWIKTKDDCITCGGCAGAPSGAPGACGDIYAVGCIPPPPTTTTPAPFCGGSCTWVYIIDEGGWILTRRECFTNILYLLCTCDPPSVPPTGATTTPGPCTSSSIPCFPPAITLCHFPVTTTLSPGTTTVGPGTTPPPGTTTTQSPYCTTTTCSPNNGSCCGGCTWRGDANGGWTIIAVTCSNNCFCTSPLYASSSSSETASTPCGPLSTTTTTTPSPTPHECRLVTGFGGSGQGSCAPLGTQFCVPVTQLPSCGGGFTYTYTVVAGPFANIVLCNAACGNVTTTTTTISPCSQNYCNWLCQPDQGDDSWTLIGNFCLVGCQCPDPIAMSIPCNQSTGLYVWHFPCCSPNDCGTSTTTSTSTSTTTTTTTTTGAPVNYECRLVTGYGPEGQGSCASIGSQFCVPVSQSSSCGGGFSYTYSVTSGPYASYALCNAACPSEGPTTTTTTTAAPCAFCTTMPTSISITASGFPIACTSLNTTFVLARVGTTCNYTVTSGGNTINLTVVSGGFQIAILPGCGSEYDYVGTISGTNCCTGISASFTTNVGDCCGGHPLLVSVTPTC